MEQFRYEGEAFYAFSDLGLLEQYGSFSLFDSKLVNSAPFRYSKHFGN